MRQTAAGRSAAKSADLSDNADNEIVLGVLDAVERDPAITQRSVAKELGIALGLANAYLKRCVRKGLIKVSEVPARRYAYYLTPQGFTEKSRLTASYLAHSFSFFRRARTQCADVFDDAAKRGQTRLVLLGGGDLADIAMLVAREKNGIEIAGILNVIEAAGLQRQIKTFGQIDAVVVTALEDPRVALEIALSVFTKDRVHVPDLLRVQAGRSTSSKGAAA